MKRNSYIVAFAMMGLCIFSSHAWTQSPDPKQILALLDNGTVRGNIYENKLLKLRLTFPKAMQVDTTAEVADDVKEGIVFLRQGKSVNQKVIDEMIRRDRIVFALNTPQTDESVGAAMNLTIKRDETRQELLPMVENSVKFLTGSGKQRLETAIKKESFNSLTFFTFTLSLDSEGEKVLRKIYCTRRIDYLLTISISYADSRELNKMEAVLRNIEPI